MQNEAPANNEVKLQTINDAGIMLQHILALVNRRVLLAQEMKSIDERLNQLTAPNQDVLTRLGIILGETQHGNQDKNEEKS
jgi:hypothetical protein